MKWSLILFFLPLASQARPVLADLKSLQALSFEISAHDEELQVGVADLAPSELKALSRYNHRHGKCAGFEVLPPSMGKTFLGDGVQALAALKARVREDQHLSLLPFPHIQKNSVIAAALGDLEAARLKDWVTWFASFPDRYNRGSDPNRAVLELKQKLETMTAAYPFAKVELIAHKSTPQKSLRVRLEGALRPQETVVLGGHLDSINTSWGGDTRAPGADDNASGSANLLEALRVMLPLGAPQRSVEFYWYAGEESGLLGSAEIAQQAKKAARDIIAVLQLDMTLFPGSGELTLSSITDFTSPWLRDLLSQLNALYVNARVIEGQCGYACSDHASWYRQGYPTVLPFESSPRRMNENIHSSYDLIDKSSDFEHSLTFSKLALAFALELANSSARQP
jgi:leucyl aminopeptidase